MGLADPLLLPRCALGLGLVAERLLLSTAFWCLWACGPQSTRGMAHGPQHGADSHGTEHARFWSPSSRFF